MILVIGDTSEQLANWTINEFGSGHLINNENYNLLSNSVYFTGLGDLTFDQIKTIALSANKVYFVEELPWLDKDALSKTIILCNHISQFKPVVGFIQKDPELFLTLPVDRKYKEPILWTIGCSHTAGVGLNDPGNEVYGKLLANKLNMKWQNIAKPGSSTRWSLTHLLHAEIQPIDIVVWATTSAERIRRATPTIKEVVLASGGDKESINYYSDDQIIFEHLDYINTGVKYMRRNSNRFVLLSLLNSSPYFNHLELAASNYKEWCPVLDWNTHDVGYDNIHIGPIGHEKLAERIYNHIQLLEYDKSL